MLINIFRLERLQKFNVVNLRQPKYLEIQMEVRNGW